ncbi:GGDEF domain-containing protein [Kordiimonas sediminis]|uniref:diguanylate cyclase n=1 Tax=Kordiimonas sediminis TaxID=1735581 RepID=A0A919ASR0_9PROT|nr:GGDEF domain-containing protein [Kordiimonas sediminis]GHF20269.1 GGDEF domain-containing protein [Kordiimonas sediminis]
MKISNTPGTYGPGRAAATGRTQKSGSTTRVGTPSSVRDIHDTVEVQSIPADEMTPAVQRAIMQLVEEVDALRRELHEANKRLKDIEDLADMDPLLPIPNRRAFVRELSRMISFAQRYGAPSTLVFIDLNDMKYFNDTYGHDVGDQVLLHVANLLIANVRDTDIVARLGGDEFGLILAQADDSVGHNKAEALINLIQSHPIEINGKPYSLKMAFGTYTFSGNDEPKEVIDKADRAMYEKKRAMKNAEPR